MTSLLSLHALRYNRGGPGGILDHTIEHVRRGHRPLLVGHQQILAGSPVRVYHSKETRQVEVIERSLGLVEHAERPRIATRAAEEDAEKERQREQRPLPTREDAQRLPPPPSEPEPDLDPLLREIQDPRSTVHHPRHHLSESPPHPAERIGEPNLYLSVYR